MVTAATDRLTQVWDRVSAVPDPELPMITIADLGILRDVAIVEGVVRVTITPTYAGCPAMDAIRADIEAAAAPEVVEVRTVLAPAWSTDQITAAGREALEVHGIAPPGRASGLVDLVLTVRCPQCGSPDTREISRFSSTACKALRVCSACAEPFDAVKPY